MSETGLPTNLELGQLCFDIYQDPPAGHWDNIWPTRFGFAGHVKRGDISILIRRGSKEPMDWWVDLDFTPVDTLQLGELHAGFFGDVLWTRKRIESVLQPRVYMGGHSLGAAETAIHAGVLASEKKPPEKVFLCGCPRPGFQKLRDVLAEVPVESFKNPGDPVTTVPPWTMFWPYVEPADFTMLGDHADPADTGLFRAHHMSVYLKGLQA